MASSFQKPCLNINMHVFSKCNTLKWGRHCEWFHEYCIFHPHLGNMQLQHAIASQYHPWVWYVYSPAWMVDFLWLMWDTLHPYHPLWWNSPSHERMMETQGNALIILSRNFMHKKLLPKNRADGQNTCRCQHGWTPIQNTIKTHVKTCPSIRRICREVTCALSSGLCPRVWFLPRQGSKWTNFRTHRIQVWYSRSLQLV